MIRTLTSIISFIILLIVTPTSLAEYLIGTNEGYARGLATPLKEKKEAATYKWHFEKGDFQVTFIAVASNNSNSIYLTNFCFFSNNSSVPQSRLLLPGNVESISFSDDPDFRLSVDSSGITDIALIDEIIRKKTITIHYSYKEKESISFVDLPPLLKKYAEKVNSCSQKRLDDQEQQKADELKENLIVIFISLITLILSIIGIVVLIKVYKKVKLKLVNKKI